MFFHVLPAVTKGLIKHFCSMEKEDLKILNKGGEEEMVRHSHWASLPNSSSFFS